MSETRHTPAPWMVAPCSDRDETRDIVANYSEHEEDGRTIKQAAWICELDAQLDFDSDVEKQFAEMEANAHLIAAAPDLLATLKGVSLWLQSFSMPPTSTIAEKQAQIAAIEAAIQKAEGH